MNPRILFIHGMFLTPESWRSWEDYFTKSGFDCETPAWPLHNAEPATLRAAAPPGLGSLTLADVYSYHARLVRLEEEPPIVIGHSLGGLIVQKLAAAGLIRAGVCICPVAPNRMMAADWGFLRNTVSITNPLAGDDPFEMTEERFRQNFGNQMSESDSREAWARYAVPESRQVLRDILTDEGQVDVEKPHVPLLFIGAEKDEIIPAPLVRRNAHAYTDPRSHAEYREFSGRGHFIHGENGWEEVALSVENWLTGHLSAVRS